ncbi:MAG: RIP metalloprotease RseP [Erysipelotrichaceae bacterium]|nr:RIP metalloprotease RseP [Erysipelotrichaceae bacterium]
MSTIINILLLILMMGLIIAIHEFGHLVAAKIFNVYVSEYSIGMGPLICFKQYGETKYSLRAFPLGGFCAIAGDNDNDLEPSVDTTNIPYERTLKGISPIKKIVVMLAGIFMNFILAWVIFSMVILSNGYYATSSKPQIEAVVENSPAEAAGIMAGDIVEKAELPNGLSITPDTYSELVSFLSAYDGNGAWKFRIDRDGTKVDIEVTPEFNIEEDRYLVGISFSNAGTELVEMNIFNCFYYSLDYMKMLVKLMISSIVSMFTGRLGIDNLSGPVGIYSTVAETVNLGFVYYIQLIAIISMNIGIMNALPLPIFDGGRVVITLFEVIIGKPISKKLESVIMTASMVLLILLMIVVTYNDIGKVFGG